MSIHKTNKDVPFIHHEMIVEWDIKSANTSLIRYYSLLDEKQVDRIESLSKEKRNVIIGKMMKQKDFSINLEKSFTSIIQEFISANSLEWEDIVSIKKDAIFVRNKEIKQNRFGPVTFLRKNQYSGCLLLPKFEFYYSNDKIDVKGISDTVLSLHKDGMMLLVDTVMKESRNWRSLNRLLKEYASLYKNKALPYNAYREFNSDSKFIVNMFGNIVRMDNIDDELLDMTDISFNYINVYLEILKSTAN